MYSIPTEKFETLNSKISAWNKKNIRLGRPVIRLNHLGFEFKKIENSYYSFTNFTVDGNIPLVKGWKMIAVVDHVNGANIVNNVAGVDIPEEFFTREPFCDHCKTKRVKVVSLLIQNVASKEWMHVGKSCANDFFGEDIHGLIDNMYYLKEIKEDAESEKGFGSGVPLYDFNEVLEVSFAAIRMFGFHKSDEQAPTKYDVADYFGMNERNINVNNTDITNAKNAQTFLNESSTSDFIKNLNTIRSMGYIPFKYFGFVAGLASSYLKSISRKNEAISFNNEYVGTIKDRMELTVTLLHKHTFEGSYGYVHLHTFKDDENHKFSWFASNETDLEINDNCVIKATIKKHDEYKGLKQTTLTRVSVISLF